MERLQTLYGSVNVYINKMFLNRELQIHVSFVDNKNKLHVLLMQRSPAGWKIAEQAKQPGWIMALQEQLNSLIKNAFIGDCYLPKASEA